MNSVYRTRPRGQVHTGQALVPTEPYPNQTSGPCWSPLLPRSKGRNYGSVLAQGGSGKQRLRSYFALVFITFIYLFIYPVGGCAVVGMWESALPFHHVERTLVSHSCHVWQHVPLPTEPSHIGLSRYSSTPFSRQLRLWSESGTGDVGASLTAPWRGPRRPTGTGE